MRLSITEDDPQSQSPIADHSSKPKSSSRPSQNDTQWELEKCRELLRVQFNLNSIYKKEVSTSLTKPEFFFCGKGPGLRKSKGYLWSRWQA